MAFGELRRTSGGKWAVIAPSECTNGHPFGPQRSLVGHAACSCGNRGGHMTWACRTCDDVIYGPPLGPDCSIRTGPDER